MDKKYTSKKVYIKTVLPKTIYDNMVQGKAETTTESATVRSKASINEISQRKLPYANINTWVILSEQ